VQYSKQELRVLAKERLSQLTDEDHRRKSILLSRNLDVLLKEQKAIHKKIDFGAFAPLKDEADWFLELDMQNIKVGYPALNDFGEMVFFESQLSELRETMEFGVKLKTPCSSRKKKMTPNLILIPGLGFSAQGARLGRGKGFFDKYLENYKGMKIGICFKEQVFETIPTERHDQLVDIVVTDGKIFRR